MPSEERPKFDFSTNRWLGGPPPSHPVAISEPSEGRWNKPAKPLKQASWLEVLIVLAFAIGTFFILPFPTAIALDIVFPLMYFSLKIDRQTNAGLRATETDLRLLEDADDLDVCLVLITIQRNGKTVGTDRGVVWFADGRLLFNGHRTSFVIGGEDVLPQDQWDRLATTAESILPENSLPLRVGDGTAAIKLQALSTPGSGIGSAQEMRYLKRLYEFRRRPPQSRGPRQWPPFTA